MEEVKLVVGELNAKVERDAGGIVAGNFELGEGNERGDKWVEWCEVWDHIALKT